MNGINLKAADSAEIEVLVDNVFDILASGQEHIKRFRLTTDGFFNPLPIAEHGYSVLVRITSGSLKRTILFDTGVSENGIIHNLNALGIHIENLDNIVLSHGHGDHAMGLMVI